MSYQEIDDLKYFIIIFTVFALITGCSIMESDKGGSEPVAAKKKQKAVKEQKMQKVEFLTSMGNFTVELYADKAPITVANFLEYVDDGFYSDTIFHRVISGFMVQCGGFDTEMEEKENKRPPIKNEADNGLLNSRGTLSMARTSDINSATSQFFINVKDNAFLDHGQRDFGYAVFAKVVDGMDVVDKIAAVKTGSAGFHDDVPLEPVIINEVKRVK